MLNLNETVRSKLKFEEHPKRTYIFPIVFLLLLLSLFFHYDLFRICSGAPLYMLSALVQSEAAILGIVTAFTLVAVQFTATNYSSKITNIFVREYDFWVVVLSYILAITTGLAVLGMIETNPQLNLSVYILLSYFFGIYCFTMIIPYTYNMLIMLKTTRIIDRLSREINRDNILRKDPIYPIMDIIRSSTMRYDYETVRYGLKVVRCKLISIFEEEKTRKEKISTVSMADISHKILRDNLTVTGKLLISNKDEDSVMRLIGTIWSITQITPENEPLLQKAADSFGELGKGAAEYRLLCTADIVEALGELGRIAIDRKYSWTARSIAESLGEIRKLGVVYNLLLAERRAEIYLRDLGEKANEKLPDVLPVIERSLQNNVK